MLDDMFRGQQIKTIPANREGLDALYAILERRIILVQSGSNPKVALTFPVLHLYLLDCGIQVGNYGATAIPATRSGKICHVFL